MEPEPVARTVAARVRRLRRARGWSAEEIAVLAVTPSDAYLSEPVAACRTHRDGLSALDRLRVAVEDLDPRGLPTGSARDDLGTVPAERHWTHLTSDDPRRADEVFLALRAGLPAMPWLREDSFAAEVSDLLTSGRDLPEAARPLGGGRSAPPTLKHMSAAA